MKVGNSRLKITPRDEKFYLLGFKTPLRNQPAKGVHDDIFCNSLLFSDQEGLTFICSLDLLELEDDFVEKIKTLLNADYGIKRDRIVIAVTHDHSSVRDFHKNWEFGEFNKKYYDFLKDTIIYSYKTAQKNLKEATVKYGEEIVTGYYSNRNHLNQLADNKVEVVKFYDKNNRSFAGLVNWATHSTVLGPSNLYLTGDMAGQTCQKLGESWGFYPLFLVGAAGDCSNRNDRQGKDFSELERVSSGLAEKISHISMEKSLSLKTGSYLTLAHSIYSSTESYNQILLQTIAEIQASKIKSLNGVPNAELINKCREQLDMADFQLLLQMEVLDLGDLRIFIFPGELGSKFAEQLRNSTNKTVLIAGYSNGFHHYFLPSEEYGRSFETIGNPIPKGEPEKIIAKFIQGSKLLDK